jgi:hypothetical protein
MKPIVHWELRLRAAEVLQIMGAVNESGNSLRTNPQVVAREVGDQTVLVHLETNRIFALNETAGQAWDLLSKGLDREEIRTRLLGRYSVEDAELDRELDKVFAEWTAEGLVVHE